jgi:pimeloyl-ACP methyl ester carboxylesterase
MAADPIVSVVPSARVELFEDAGHALFVDDAERFNRISSAICPSRLPYIEKTKTRSSV